MKTAENQKIVVIVKEAADKDNPYSIINLTAFDNALQQLKGNTFKMWCYLAKNQNEYSFALSRVAACRELSMGRNSYLSSVNELIEKGFLVQKEKDSSKYLFYELPSTYSDPETAEDLTIEYPKAETNFVF